MALSSRQLTAVFLVLFAGVFHGGSSFVVHTGTVPKILNGPSFRSPPRTTRSIMMALFDDPDAPKSLTRDSEPEEFFKTNTDKMSDAEKLPIALGGLAFISIPFLAGLLVLYSQK